MRVPNHVRLMPAFLMLLLAFAPVAEAQEPESDEEIQVVPPVNQSTPDSFLIPETCDPLALVLCVGPIGEDAPVVVVVSSDGVVLSVWLHEDESESVGPVQETVTVPVTGTEVPLTLCPNTCPVPVPPEADATGGASVCVTVGATTECIDDPNPLGTVFAVLALAEAVLDGLDRDGDFVPNDVDNCPDTPNTTQSDGDLDGAGDACDPDTVPPYGGLADEVETLLDIIDRDGDGVPTLIDNCPDHPNTSQADADLDGWGDACDSDTRDLVADAMDEVEELLEEKDGDGDLVPDLVDNCPDDANASQMDSDLDGIGDACDEAPADGSVFDRCPAAVDAECQQTEQTVDEICEDSIDVDCISNTVMGAVHEHVPPCVDRRPDQYVCFGGTGAVGIRAFLFGFVIDI